MLSNTLIERFKKSFWWSFFGSLFFECFKIAHQIALMHNVAPQTYGQIGMLYALIYCTVRLGDFGTTTIISSYFSLLTGSQSKMRQFIFGSIGISYSIIITTLAIAVTWFNHNTITNLNISAIIIIALIISESIRALLRHYLHLSFLSKSVVILEQLCFFMYLVFLWVSIIIFHHAPSGSLIFIPFLLESLLCVIVLLFFAYTTYTTFPINHQSIDSVSLQSMHHNRIAAFFIRLCREMYTSNILTPLFAGWFGLLYAGKFYFIATTIMSIYAIIKTVINNSGLALLTRTQRNNIIDKQEAFTTLNNYFLSLILPVFIISIINYPIMYYYFTQQSNPVFIISIAIFYSIITSIDLCVITLEQMYYAEGIITTLLQFKITEIVFSLAILLCSYHYTIISPLTILALAVFNKILFFILNTHNAYKQWGIAFAFPYFYKKIFALSIFAGMLINATIRYYYSI